MQNEEGFVEDLEDECEQALRAVVEEYYEDLPKRTVHLMAKAAVAVLEAVVDDHEMDEGDDAAFDEVEADDVDDEGDDEADEDDDAPVEV